MINPCPKVLSIYIVTLGCFPALTVLVEPVHQSGSVWQVVMMTMMMRCKMMALMRRNMTTLLRRKLTALMRMTGFVEQIRKTEIHHHNNHYSNLLTDHLLRSHLLLPIVQHWGLHGPVKYLILFVGVFL